MLFRKNKIFAAVRSDKYKNFTATQKLEANNEYLHTLSHAESGEMEVTTNQLRKLDSYVASRKPVSRIKRRALAISGAVLFAFTAFAGGMSTAAAAPTGGKHVVEQVVTSKAQGPFVAARLKAVEPCPAGFAFSKAGKKMTKAQFVKFNGKTLAKKATIKAGRLLCAKDPVVVGNAGDVPEVVAPEENTGVGSGNWQRPAKGKFDLKVNAAGEVTGPRGKIELNKENAQGIVVSPSDLAELARQMKKSKFEPGARLDINTQPSGPPLILAEAPDSVDLLSIRRGADGELIGTWVVRGGYGLASDNRDNSYVRLSGSGTEITVEKTLKTRTSVSGATLAQLGPIVYDDYGQFDLPTDFHLGLTMGSALSVSSKQGNSFQQGAGDHYAVINLDTLEVIENQPGSTPPRLR